MTNDVASEVVAAINRQLRGEAGSFDVAGRHDRIEIARRILEGLPVPAWVRQHLATLRRAARASEAKREQEDESWATAVARSKQKLGLDLTTHEAELIEAADRKDLERLQRLQRP